MIDMHCHLLYGVDDGSKSIEESVEMLKIAKKQGITGIILTPHLRHGMFKHPLEKIERHYKKLMPYAKKLGIELKLGTEYHVSDLVGIGANIGYISGSLPEDKFGNPNEEDGSTGIFRLHFNVGVRFHF